jgi:hypothetical protein
MAGGLPPPPTRAASGDFAWTAWNNELYKLLSTQGAVSWSQINKSGSSISDLQNKNHNLLTSMQGGTSNEYYHMTSAQATKVAALGTMSAKNIGVSGTFKSADTPQKTITVVDGIITNIV